MANKNQDDRSSQNQQNPRNPQSKPDQQKQQERDGGQMGGPKSGDTLQPGKSPADKGGTGQGNP